MLPQPNRLPSATDMTGAANQRKKHSSADRTAAARSALRLKLPRPTVLKSGSPMAAELMWELPTPSTRTRRKSLPGHVDTLTHFAVPKNCSTSQPELKVNIRSLSVPSEQYTSAENSKK